MAEQVVDSLVSAIASAAESLPEVQAAFLFGSQASGRARIDSDIDVAVLLEGTPVVDARSRLRSVIAAFAAHVAADRLDTVILNDAPPALAFQILKSGKLAFERDRTALHRFRVRTYARHSDFEPTERFFRAVTRQRSLARPNGG